MRTRTPSRYERSRGHAGGIRHLLEGAIEFVHARLLTLFVERILLGRLIGDRIRPSVMRIMAPRLSMLEQVFDHDFYLRQFDDHARRLRVGRAPLLHYTLLGWRTRRAPAPAFDPAFYRRAYLTRRRPVEPLLDYLANPGRTGLARNEVEARADHAPWREQAETVLVFHHGRGGGSSHFLDLYEREMEMRGRNVLRARAVLSAPALAVVGDRAFDLSSDLGALAAFARQRNVTRLLVNHLVDRPRAAMEWLRELAARLGVPYDVVLHDYYMLCPRIDLVTGRGICCEAAPPDACVQCVAEHGAEVSDVDALTWRRDHLKFLTGAERLIAPSDDLATRMGRHLPKEIEVWEPEPDTPLPPERPARVSEGEPLRIATLGALNVSKGLRVLQALAAAIDRTGAPVRLSVVGPTSEPLPASVSVSGAYHPADVDRLLADAAPHVVFLPAIWPETWSFVLTAALGRGLPVVVFDIGAPAARLRRLGRGIVLPLELSRDPTSLLETLLEMRGAWTVR